MAVYTEVTDEDMTGFLARYSLGRVLSLKGIAEGVQNSNFLLRTEGGEFILTLYESQVDVGDLPFFLGLMAHLAAKGITCPQPVPMRAGDLSGTLAGRPAAIFTFLDGVWIRRPGVAHCAALGTALAGFHSAGADFAMTRRNALGPDDWRPLFLRSKARADEVVAGLADEISAELDELDRRFPRDLPTGVIHADLFPDNVFFLGDRLSGLIDFYFACTDAYAYDVAVCLNSWCFETDGSFNQTKGRAFLTAYEAVRPLSPAEAAALPILCRGSALRFLLTRLYDWLNVPPGALVRPKDPLEYLRKVRFHRAVSDARDYGLTRPDARA